MDYSKVKFVKPSVGGDYFTKGKAYAVLNLDGNGGELIDDNGDERYTYFPESAHLNDNPFIPCHEDGRPLFPQELTPLEAEMLALLNNISGELLRSDFVLSEKWYDIINETIKKAKQ